MKFPERLIPMNPHLVDMPPEGQAWIHEIKHDGYRMLSRVRGRDIRMVSRQGLDWSARFPRVIRDLGGLGVSEAYLDGEIVALGPDGKSCFGELQATLAGQMRAPLSYCLFDVVFLNGRDLSSIPIEERKKLLHTILPESHPVLRYVDHLQGRGPGFFRECRNVGLEGVVSKRLGTPYDPGHAGTWLKSKCRRCQEFVVIGFTAPSAASDGFGGLVLGVNDPSGALLYSGGVGTGFDPRSRDALKYALPRLAVESSCLDHVPKDLLGEPIVWVRPHLVAMVAFTNWTRAGVIRHGTFRGLRMDKPWQDVVREHEDQVLH